MRRTAYGSKGSSTSASRRAVDWDTLCFFLIAVGYKVPWTAISSLLHQFKQQFHEPRVLLWLNLAYFLPSLPALLLHSSLQDVLESKLGVATAATARFVLGLGGLCVLCWHFPAFSSSSSSSLPALLAATAAVGVAYSIAFGTSHQLAPRFNPSCTVALTTGFVSCGVVVLLADLALKSSAASYTPAAMTKLFRVVAAQTAIGLISALLMLRRHRHRLQAATAGGGAGAGKQRSHMVTVLGPSSGHTGVLSRSGSGGSSSGGGSMRQLLLPKSSWDSGYAAAGGSFGARHHNSCSHHFHHQYHHRHHHHFHQTHHQQQQQQDVLDSTGLESCQRSSSSSTAAAVSIQVHQSRRSSSGNSSSSSSSSTGGPGIWSSAPPGLTADSFRDQQYQHTLRKQQRPGGRRINIMMLYVQRRLQPLIQLAKLAAQIWPAWLALLLSVGSSMLAFPLFTYVDTSGSLGERLPQVLFYARLLGDILGRMVPPSYQLKTSRAVLLGGVLKASLLLLLVPAILQPSCVGGDLALATLVAANWWLSGYVNTGAYLLAPRLVTADAYGRPVRGAYSSSLPSAAATKAAAAASSSSSAAGLKAKAGGLMAFCFQVACLLGLLGAWVVQETLHSSGHPAAVAAAAAGAAAAPGQVAVVDLSSLTTEGMSASAAAGAAAADVPFDAGAVGAGLAGSGAGAGAAAPEALLTEGAAPAAAGTEALSAVGSSAMDHAL